MPRQARLDASGPLHHVMIRGIEGIPMGGDNQDREHFLSRVGQIAERRERESLPWFSWAITRICFCSAVYLDYRGSSEGSLRVMQFGLTGGIRGRGIYSRTGDSHQWKELLRWAIIVIIVSYVSFILRTQQPFWIYAS